MESNNQEAVILFDKGTPQQKVIPLEGFNEEIANSLIEALQWDAGLEASTGIIGVSFDTPYQYNGSPTKAYVEIGAYISFDEKNHYNIEVTQEDGYLISSDGRYTPNIDVVVNTNIIEQLMQKLMPNEEDIRGEFSEAVIRQISENVMRRLNEGFFDADNKPLFDSGEGLELAKRISKALNISVEDAKIEAKTVIDDLYCDARQGGLSLYSMRDELGNVGLDMDDKLVDIVSSLVQSYQRPDLDDDEDDDDVL